MHKHHKMHWGEIAFHVAVPVVMVGATAAMGYYVFTLVMSIMRIA